MLLSYLAVHREQMGDEATYLDRHSAQFTADAVNAFVPLDEAQRARQATLAKETALQRVTQFASDVAELAGTCEHGLHA